MAAKIQLTNLLKMIAEIKTNPGQSPEDLYSSLGISKSGFYKYKNVLATELGFHFHYDRGQRCFVIDQEPFLPVTLHLTPSELSALVMSMGQFYASGGDYIITYHGLKAVQKIVANFPDKKLRRQFEELFDETVYNRGYGCKDEILTVVECAWETRQILQIRYFSHSDGMCEVVHEVEPYMIFFKRRALYMDALCRNTGDVRLYRLNRIRQAVILPQTAYEVRPDYSFKRRHQHAFSVFTGGAPTRVRIRFHARKAAYIEEVRWHASQIITPDPVHLGSIIFEVNVSHPEEVIWWMRQWGSDAEVLEPQAMRDYMLTMAQAEAAMYRQPV